MNEAISELYDAQFAAMPQMRDNYTALGQTERRVFNMGDLNVAVQFNPARVRSTAAKVSKEDIEARPCFLCRKNRPEKQLIGTTIPDWDILINPYPILPVHFTVASKEHTPQSGAPLEMVDMVNTLPDLCTFYNGANAGASAPDHLHFQAVLRSELPLLAEVEKRHTTDMPRAVKSTALGNFPMKFMSFIVPPDFSGMQMLAMLPTLGGLSDDAETRRGLVNLLMWKDASGWLRVIVIPRRRHRPDCYFAEGEEKMLVSPGALDMAGIIVTPRREDFDRITPEQIEEIYRQTGLTEAELDEYALRRELAPFVK